MRVSSIQPLGRAVVRSAVACTALAAALAASVTSGVAAPATGPTFGSFGMTPATAASGQPRSYFNFSVRPGQTVRDSVVVTNLSHNYERLQMTVAKGVTATNSGSAYENVNGRCVGPSCWVSGLPPTIVLAPKEQRLVGFAVSVPSFVGRGQYLTGITVLAAKNPKAVQVGKRGHSSAQAIVIDEVTVGVALTIGDLSKLTTRLRIGQVSTQWIGTMPRLNIPVANTGQTFVRATGKIRCLSGARTHSYGVTMETVLPEGGAALPVNAPGLQVGSFACQVRLRTDTGSLVRWSGRVSLASTVATRTYHPAKGVYVSLPEPTTPAWAIALMVLGGLIFFTLLLMLIRRRRGVRAAAAAPALAQDRTRPAATATPVARNQGRLERRTKPGFP